MQGYWNAIIAELDSCKALIDHRCNPLLEAHASIPSDVFGDGQNVRNGFSYVAWPLLVKHWLESRGVKPVGVQCAPNQANEFQESDSVPVATLYARRWGEGQGSVARSRRSRATSST